MTNVATLHAQTISGRVFYYVLLDTLMDRIQHPLDPTRTTWCPQYLVDPSDVHAMSVASFVPLVMRKDKGFRVMADDMYFRDDQEALDWFRRLEEDPIVLIMDEDGDILLDRR